MAGNIEVILGGILLPTPDVPFKKVTEPQEADTITLNGTMYTDFTNYRRSWQLQWGKLSKTDYDIIEGIFNDQYANEAYPLLEIDYYNVLAPVKVSMSDQDIRHDGDCIVDFSITLSEQYAVS